MAYNFSPLKAKVTETEEWLKKEYQGIRTGRATPTLLDSIQVESYGSRMPLKQVGAISVEDARTLRVSPWDATQVKVIEKAIADANLGVGVSADDKGVRVTFPELTSERRDGLIKLSKDRLEHARVSLRNERDDVWNDIQEKEREGEISEDEKFRYKEEMQKMVDGGNERLDLLFKRKEEEIKH
jgi:ribosome recycling factor